MHQRILQRQQPDNKGHPAIPSPQQQRLSCLTCLHPAGSPEINGGQENGGNHVLHSINGAQHQQLQLRRQPACHHRRQMLRLKTMTSRHC